MWTIDKQVYEYAWTVCKKSKHLNINLENLNFRQEVGIAGVLMH